MEFDWLRTFKDAAETLNFRKTSERLMMSQPSVTVHIRLLEERLGLRLFKREKNRVSLTEEGFYFLKRANRILLEMDESIEELHAFAQGYRQKWRLAITPLMAETVLPHLLKSFMKDHPDIELVIRVEESANIEELIRRNEVAAGLSALPPTERSIAYETVYEDPLVFVVPRDAYEDESGPVLVPERILQSSVLFTHHHPAFWEELLLKLRREVTGIRTMKVTQAHIAKRFIEEGLGVSFLPKSIVRRELLEGRVMDVPFSLLPLPSVSTYFMAYEMGGIEREFLQLLQHVYFK